MKGRQFISLIQLKNEWRIRGGLSNVTLILILKKKTEQLRKVGNSQKMNQIGKADSSSGKLLVIQVEKDNH